MAPSAQILRESEAAAAAAAANSGAGNTAGTPLVVEKRRAALEEALRTFPKWRFLMVTWAEGQGPQAVIWSALDGVQQSSAFEQGRGLTRKVVGLETDMLLTAATADLFGLQAQRGSKWAPRSNQSPAILSVGEEQHGIVPMCIVYQYCAAGLTCFPLVCRAV